MAQAHPILENSGFNPDKKLKIVGSSPAKHDGYDKVTGRAKFGADMFLPGMLVASDALLKKNPDPSEEEVRFWLAGNLCRCTGYDKIVRAVMDTAAEMRAQ